MKDKASALVTPMLLERVGEAFTSIDINPVMQCFAPDAIFDHALGSEAYGTRFEGLEENTSTKWKIWMVPKRAFI